MRAEISVRDMEIFHAIATTGSTRQAGVQLGITQSAASHALARLEDTLGIRLFTRENQRLQIAPAGRYMLDEAVQLLDRLKRIEEEMALFQESGLASLRIGCAPGLGHRFGPRLAQQYVASHPGTGMALDIAASGRLISEVDGGRLDLALVSYQIHEPGLIITPVFAAQMMALLCRRNRLAARKRLHYGDLADQRYIKPMQSDHLIYANTSHDRQLDYSLRVSMSALGEVIRLSNGVSLLNALTAADLCVHGDLVARPFDSAQWFTFYLVHQHAMKDNRAVADVLAIAKDCVRQTAEEAGLAGAFVIH
ncbi:LysR family transcriptional regulator [Verminephrobacter aporrectodeae subsp. tuberculatae]|uniref:LysR family transcriptional regulator n=1 Tax=Verminephrobacter aporrectodeae TaxID=1110389 RepID=UPI0002376C1B|nr:LysR family transcriptional regulator [Verminephrobacter aporrectodeae]MCW8199959.1 LysR family transcriptional regulator [Verminephrobacter aporrectodeae subsp. tuberculatae]